MGKLLDYLGNNTEIDDLQTLAFKSGVDYKLLFMLDNGTVTLSSSHIDILVSILGSDSLSVLSSAGSIGKLETVVSHKGASPIDYQLQVIPAGSAMIGDLLSYVPPTSLTGSHWVRIDVILTKKLWNHYFVDLYSDGVKLVSIAKSQIIRIARRAAN